MLLNTFHGSTYKNKFRPLQIMTSTVLETFVQNLIYSYLKWLPTDLVLITDTSNKPPDLLHNLPIARQLWRLSDLMQHFDPIDLRMLSEHTKILFITMLTYPFRKQPEHVNLLGLMLSTYDNCFVHNFRHAHLLLVPDEPPAVWRPRCSPDTMRSCAHIFRPIRPYWLLCTTRRTCKSAGCHAISDGGTRPLSF